MNSPALRRFVLGVRRRLSQWLGLAAQLRSGVRHLATAARDPLGRIAAVPHSWVVAIPKASAMTPLPTSASTPELPGSLAVPSNLRLPNARSERLGVPKPPVRASRPPRIEGVDAVRIGPNASTRTGRLGFAAADVRSGGVLGKQAASGGVAHGEGAVSMSTRAHRGTSRAFWKPIRAPECRPPISRQATPWHCPGPAANRNANEAPGRLTPLSLARMPQRTP